MLSNRDDRKPGGREAVARSEISPRQVLDAVGNAVIVSARDTTIIEWNPGAEALYGWAASEVVGRHPFEVTASPDSEADDAVVMRTVRSGRVWSGDYTARRRDGSTVVLHASCSAIRDDHGDLVGIVSVSHDVTVPRGREATLRHDAERYAAAVESAPMGIWTWDLATGVVEWDEPWRRGTGSSPDRSAGRSTTSRRGCTATTASSSSTAGYGTCSTGARSSAGTAPLQEKLVGAAFPEVVGCEVAARYVPAEDAPAIGGDWYDAFVVPDGAMVLSVGDVSGHGVDAARFMAKLRHATRAYACMDGDLPTLLDRLDLFLAQFGEEAQIATTLLVRLDPATGEFACVSAGRPLALLVDDTGSRFLDVVPGPPLGAFRARRVHPCARCSNRGARCCSTPTGWSSSETSR